ncbi:MAG TPA: D-glycero-beta-D-manno-heptose 1-phosphate adenylyltransferase [Candidatus Wallbacteria bacterium]|nr:D-glycero-beta-D-manno-heptose 1-phosphate adenylyltransferase [Candidatus Wallbacteria bacterium]
MREKSAFHFSNPSSRRELNDHLKSLKSRGGFKIVFTNGCFDILHVGHLRYLKQARDCGNYLIIGLNTDSSVSRNKGPKRPVVSEAERAELLLGLECVDCVVYFDEETPKDIIEFIKPDVLVKGAEYEEKDIVGAAFVRSYGGELVRAKMIENSSTTNIIDRILQLENTAVIKGEKK